MCLWTAIIPGMSISEQIQKDITQAMKARDEQRLSALRMVKTALKHREVEKMSPLDEKESLQVLSTLIKQRRDSADQFRKGERLGQVVVRSHIQPFYFHLGRIAGRQ